MCWKCNNSLKNESAFSRSAVCEKCGADVRCCKNCSYYSLGSHYDCHETIDEPVYDKERATFCGFFSLNAHDGNVSSTGKKMGIDSKKTFTNLFGD